LASADELVLADRLLEAGDERGELILVRHRLSLEGPSEALDLRHLELFHRYGDSWLLPGGDPDADILPADEGGGAFPVQYHLFHGADNYYVRYRHHGLSVERNDEGVELLETDLDLVSSGEWTPEETNVFLWLLSEGIRAGDLAAVRFPTAQELPRHPRYRLGPNPRYVTPLGTIAVRDHTRWTQMWDRYCARYKMDR
jgi:hypothetical protein